MHPSRSFVRWTAIGCSVGLVVVAVSCSRNTAETVISGPIKGPLGVASAKADQPPVAETLIDTAFIPSLTRDSAQSREQPNCSSPLTGLLHTISTDHGNRWARPWA